MATNDHAVIQLATAIIDPAGYDYGEDRRRYCHYCLSSTYSAALIVRHEPDCPVRLAYKVLAQLCAETPDTRPSHLFANDKDTP